MKDEPETVLEFEIDTDMYECNTGSPLKSSVNVMLIFTTESGSNTDIRTHCQCEITVASTDSNCSMFSSENVYQFSKDPHA